MIYDNYNNFVVPSISPFSGDNTNIGYYKYFTLEYTTATGITPCGDGIPNNSINFHQSSIVTTGTTGSNYFIQFTIPMISSGITYDNCDLNCIGIQNQLVDFYVNTYSSSTFNYTGTTNVGAIRNNGIYFFRSMSSSVSTQTGATLSGGFYTSFYQNYTIPASGTSYTLIPSLSGVTCPNLGLITNNGDSLTSQNIQRNYNYYYVWEFFDETAVADNFRIYAHRINESGNLVFPREITLVYEYLNGTLNYSNSNYLI